MSCIQRILAVKGDKDYLVFGPGSAVEGGGSYRGYDYLVTFRDLGFRCAYVAIPSDDALPSLDFEDIFIDLEVHGGITFNEKPGILEGLPDFIDGPVCDDRWIGFDAGHLHDKEDLDKALSIFTHEFVSNDIKRRIAYKKEECLFHGTMIGYKDMDRSFEYMERECKKLIDQLINHQENHRMIGG